MADERVRPFSQGTQAADWIDRNCGRCVKGYDEERGDYCCPIQEALDEAAIVGDGSVSAEIGRRMGIPDGHPYWWKCDEFVRAELPASDALAAGGEGAR